MPEKEHLTFVLHGENEIVPVDSLVEAVRRIAALVLSIQTLESKGLKPRPWVVVKLASSNPTITIAPSTDTGSRTSVTVLDGLRMLADGSDSVSLPTAFGESPLEDVSSLGRLLKRRGGLTQIEVSANGTSTALPTVYIDQRIQERVRSVLAAGYSDYGSIEGKLQSVQLHGRRSVTLWDDMTGAPVRCPIPKSPFWIEVIRNALDKRVMVTGTIHYFGGGKPRWVEMDQLVELDHDPLGPRGDFGSIPDLTGDEDSVSYIRRMRD